MALTDRFVVGEFLLYLAGYLCFVVVYTRRLAAKARRDCVDPERYPNSAVLLVAWGVVYPRGNTEIYFMFPVDARDRPVLIRYMKQAKRVWTAAWFIGLGAFLIAASCTPLIVHR